MQTRLLTQLIIYCLNTFFLCFSNETYPAMVISLPINHHELTISGKQTYGLNDAVTDSQKVKLLTQLAADTILTENTRKKYGINFPASRIYEYDDEAGKHYLVLTEHALSNQAGEKNDSIKAFLFTSQAGKWKLEWTFADSRLKERGYQSKEESVWFWIRYLCLTDPDKDGIIDPIIVMGSSGLNGTDDGRITIVLFTRG